jgi:hypothetical protein
MRSFRVMQTLRQMKMPRGSWAATTQLGASTISPMRRSTATEHSA